MLIDSFEFLTKTDKVNGIFTFDQAKLLKKNNYEVVILSPGLFSPRDYFKSKLYKKFEVKNGISIYRKYKKNFLPTRINAFNPLIVKKISSLSIDLFEEYLKKNTKPDLLHAHKIRYSLFAAHSIYLKYKIPFIITEHNSDILLNNFPNSIKEETRKIIKKSKNFNSVSNIASKKIASYFNIKKVDVLNNVIPEIFYKKFKRNKKKKNFIFLSVSRFDKNKNVKMLIDVFINNFSNLNASLYIFGGGTDINMFKYYVKKKGLQKKIKLFGFTNREIIANHYNKCDFFVIPCHQDNFVFALFESLLFKKYFITSRHSGFYELKKMKIKIPSFNSYDSNKLKKLMLHAYHSKKKFDFKQIILKNFGRKNFLNKINKLYKLK